MQGQLFTSYRGVNLLVIEVCHDMSLVKEFMQLPEVHRYAAEYGGNKEDEVFESNTRSGWLSYSVKGEIVGLVKFYLMTGTMGMFHPYILRKYKNHYDIMVQKFFKWFLSDVPEEIVKLNVSIPLVFEGAISAAYKAGMIKEGVDRLSYLSSSGPCDRLNLGITRGEIK